MPVAIIYHHEHAYDNPSMEAVIGPYADLADATPTFQKLRDDFNQGRDKEDGLWEISEDGTYLGLDDPDDTYDIATEVWAEIVELTAPAAFLAGLKRAE